MSDRARTPAAEPVPSAPADPFGEPRGWTEQSTGGTSSDPFGDPLSPGASTRRTDPDLIPARDLLAIAALSCAVIALILVPFALWWVDGVDGRLFLALAVAGVLDMVAMVLAVLSWRRPGPLRPRHRRAIAVFGGVLALCSLLAWAAVGVLAWQDTAAQQDQNAALATACVDDSDLTACDELYLAPRITAEQQETAATCGHRGDEIRPTSTCAAMTIGAEGTLVPAQNDDLEPRNHGENAALDALWESCAAGESATCDELYLTSPLGSEYEAFGRTCAGRQEFRSDTCAGMEELSAEDPVSAQG